MQDEDTEFFTNEVDGDSAGIRLDKFLAAQLKDISRSRLQKLIGEFGTAFGMLTGLIGCNAALLFISIVSGIRI